MPAPQAAAPSRTLNCARHGAEIAAAQREVRGEAVRRLLDIRTADACATLLTLDADD